MKHTSKQPFAAELMHKLVLPSKHGRWIRHAGQEAAGRPTDGPGFVMPGKKPPDGPGFVMPSEKPKPPDGE